MAEIIILNLGKGNLKEGFPFVSVWLQSEDKNMQFTSSLPKSPQINNLYHQWQLCYKLIHQLDLNGVVDLEIESNSLIENNYFNLKGDYSGSANSDLTNFPVEDFFYTSKELEASLNNWLENIYAPESRLREQLSPHNEIRFIIQTEDPIAKKLPWHIWKFFEDYPRAEVALSSFNYSAPSQIPEKSPPKPIKILVVVENNKIDDLTRERILLSKSTDVEISFLISPTQAEFFEQLENQRIDLLFFAESSQGKRDVFTNSEPKFKQAIHKAIARGLKIAIFSFRQESQLTEELEDINIPQKILLRESPSDVIALEFFQEFLHYFAPGESFYSAVRAARKKLQALEKEFPGASWLPIIYQNPAAILPTWQELPDSLDKRKGETPIVNTSANTSANTPHPLNLGKKEESAITLASRYQMGKQLGRGGFGRTSLARDVFLPGHPLCVVKQLAPVLCTEKRWQTAKRLFFQEGEVLQELGTHPQIPRLLAHFEENQQYYLVQEYIEGTPLNQELTPGQKYGEDYVIDLLDNVLEVLSFVHQQRVIHRDIKPANLIRRKTDGKIVLIDFGAVKEIAQYEPDALTSISSLTVAIGSRGYMPDEQQRQKPRLNSDIYAVGMIAIVALTGMTAKHLECSWIKANEEISDEDFSKLAPPIGKDLAKIINKMVRSDYRRRYRDAGEAFQALQELIERRKSPAASNPQFEGVALKGSPKSQFIDHCTQELATLIGPFAQYLITKQITANPQIQPEELVKALARQISPEQAQKFQQNVLSKKSKEKEISTPTKMKTFSPNGSS